MITPLHTLPESEPFQDSFPRPALPAIPRTPRSWYKWFRARWVFVSSGTRVRRAGIQNAVTLNDAILHRCRIEMSGSNNTLEFMPGVRAWHVSFRLVGDGLHCRIGRDCRIHQGNFVVEDENSRLHVGAGTTLYSPMIVSQEGRNISIGDDCLIAHGCDLRNSDSHSVLDAETRERINAARDIRIGNHVWLGAHVQILKGVTIDQGSIVAARSVVTKDVPARTLVAGSPTRVLRENVDWDARRL